MTNIEALGSIEDERICELSDARKQDFFITDNLFVDAEFNAYSALLYMRILKRASNNANGFFESQKTTCKAMCISENTLRSALGVLEYSNIVKVTRRRSSTNPKVRIPSKITLVDKSCWNLSHNIRSIKQYNEMKQKEKNANLNSEEIETCSDSSSNNEVHQYMSHPLPQNMSHPPSKYEPPSLMYYGENKTTFNKTTFNKNTKNGSDADDLNNNNNTISIDKTTSLAMTNKKDNNNANTLTNNIINDYKSPNNIIDNYSNRNDWVPNNRICGTNATSCDDRINQNVLETRKKRLMHNVKTLHKNAVSQNATNFVAFETIESIAAKFFDKYKSMLDLIASFLDDSIAQDKTVPIAKLESSFIAYQDFLSGKDATQHTDTCANISKNDLNVATDTKEEKAISHSHELASLSENDVKTISETQVQQTKLLSNEAKVINLLNKQHNKAIVNLQAAQQTKGTIELERLKEKHSILELKEKFKIDYILPSDLKEFFNSLNNKLLVKNIMRKDSVSKTAAEFERYYREEAERIYQKRKAKEASSDSVLKASV